MLRLATHYGGSKLHAKIRYLTMKTRLILLLALLVLGAPAFWLRVEAQTYPANAKFYRTQVEPGNVDFLFLGMNDGSVVEEGDPDVTPDQYHPFTVLSVLTQFIGTVPNGSGTSVSCNGIGTQIYSFMDPRSYRVAFTTNIDPVTGDVTNDSQALLPQNQYFWNDECNGAIFIDNSSESTAVINVEIEYISSFSTTSPMTTTAGIEIGIAWIAGLITFFGAIWMLRKQ